MCIYSLAATLSGVGLGLAAGYQFASILASTIPLAVGPFAVAPWVLLISIAVGLGVPLLAALLPLWIGTRVSVHDALSAYGISAGPAGRTPSRSDRWPAWISQTTRLGLRSVFRKPWRAGLALLTLTLAGACFLVVETAANSVSHTVSAAYATVDADIDVVCRGQTSYNQVMHDLRGVPNISLIEQYQQTHVTTQWGEMSILGVDPHTELYHYQLTSGRWLQDGDTNAVLLSDDAAASSGIHVGGTLTLTGQGGQKVTWTVIGTVSQPVDNMGWVGEAVTTVDTLNQFLGSSEGSTVSVPPKMWVQGQDRSAQAIDQMTRRVDAILNPPSATPAKVGDPGTKVETYRDYVKRRQSNWYILYALLYAVTAVVGAAGVLALANALAASVFERRREIGTLRAMGAQDRRVARVFWVEGMALGGISWAIGVVIGIPLAYAFVQQLRSVVLPVGFTIDPLAFAPMLAAILGMATLASLGPALRASRLSVAEMLRYE